ncbi:MAG: GNAT family N-acetyltransferase [Planctomycetota bacterium]|jgi:CBS domain-containing protein
MDRDFKSCSIHRYPHAFVNKRGEAVLVSPLSSEREQDLREMYLSYRPRNSFDGLPPVDDDACVRWVDGMIRDGYSLVALSFTEGLVGHVAAFPMGDRKCELFAVVRPGFQNIGIGTQLVRCLTQVCCEMGTENMWLSVDVANRRARHVYKKCGFENLDASDVQTVDMGLDLKRHMDVLNVQVRDIMSREVLSANMRESCREAAGILLVKGIASMPVTDDAGKLAGIISQTDLMQPANFNRKVEEVFTRGVVTADEGWTLERLIQLFRSRNLRAIPVLDERSRLVGMVSRRDILAYYAEKLGGGTSDAEAG